MKKTLVYLLLTLAAPTLLQATLSDGLVAFYTFTGNANDSSGNGHDGTVMGPTLTTDRFGNANSAYAFDGGSIIDVPTSPDFDLNPANGFTISVWMSMPAYVNPEHMVGRRGGAFSSYWQMAVGPGAIDPTHFPLNQWVNFVYAIGATSQGYYINGALDTTTTAMIDPVTDPLDVYIGGSDGYQAFLGSMDNVRIYNRLLSDSEIQNLYLSEVPEPGTAAVMGLSAAATLLWRARRRNVR